MTSLFSCFIKNDVDFPSENFDFQPGEVTAKNPFQPPGQKGQLNSDQNPC
jgi:hypothetical protein